MATEKKSGAGHLASSVLEKLTPPKPAVEQDDAFEAPETAESSRDRARDRKPRAGEGRGAKKAVKARTIYLPEMLFERIVVQTHRKGKTISEYVTAILERQIPDFRGAKAETSDHAA